MTHAYIYFPITNSTKNVSLFNLDQLLCILHLVPVLSLLVQLLLHVLLVAFTVHCKGCLCSLEAVRIKIE